MQIALTPLARAKIRAAVTWKDQEIAFWGRTEKEGDVVIVSDIVVPPQYAGGAHAEMEAPELDWFNDFLTHRKEHRGQWRFWGHSHPSSGTTPSGTDTATMFKLADQLGDWFVGGVFSKTSSPTGYGHIVSPFFIPVGNVPIINTEDADTDLIASIHTDCELRVKTGKPPVAGVSNGTGPLPKGSTSTGTNKYTVRRPAALVDGSKLGLSELDDAAFLTLVSKMLEEGKLPGFNSAVSPAELVAG